MSKVRHLLGISGGKDSAALAIYLKNKHPQLDIEYYTCDTGKELDETYQLIEALQVYLGKEIKLLKAADKSHMNPFDHFLTMYGGFLPSSNARWCTKKLKLEPFERFVGNDPVVSYVGIRGDEDRDGYISKRSNIQSIFPFRKNIWSEDVITKALNNSNIEQIISLLDSIDTGSKKERFQKLLMKPIEPSFNQASKLQQLLDLGTREMNHLIFTYLKSTQYPLSLETDFPLLENEDVLIRDDIFKILKESGVGVPAYYNKVEFQSEGKIGEYARSRSGCFFCFFQQKIEWVWLYEQHPELYQKAMEYEKDGYTWGQGESLAELKHPERVKQIKAEYIARSEKSKKNQSPYLVDLLGDAESEGCAACFI